MLGITSIGCLPASRSWECSFEVNELSKSWDLQKMVGAKTYLLKLSNQNQMFLIFPDGALD